MALAQAFGHEFTQGTDVASASPQAPFRVRIVEESVARFPEYYTTQLQILPNVGPSRIWVLSWGWLAAPAVIVDAPERQGFDDDDSYGLGDLEYIAAHREEWRRRWAGQWIAVKGRRVHAVAADKQAVRQQVRLLGLVEPFILRVSDRPEPEHTAYAR